LIIAQCSLHLINQIHIYISVGQSVRDPSSNIRIENKDVDNACLKYEKSVDDIVKSYGMNVDTFNALSNRLIKEPKLKQKVLRQAYYYRLVGNHWMNFVVMLCYFMLCFLTMTYLRYTNIIVCIVYVSFQNLS